MRQTLYTLEGGLVHSEMLFQTGSVALGRFRADADAMYWDLEARPIRSPLIAFARTPVEIEIRNRDPIVADPTRAVLYESDTVYRRHRLDARGERTVWIALRAEGLRDALARRLRDPASTYGSVGADVPTWAQVALGSIVRCLDRCETPDELEVEETLLAIAGSVVMPARGGHEIPERGLRRRATVEAHREAALEMSRFIARGFRERIALSDVARAAHLSAFHAARIFREQTGRSIHQQVRSTRLGEALAMVQDGGENLGAIALAVGFASHAHLTDAFGKHFGVTPSGARRGKLGGGTPTRRAG